VSLPAPLLVAGLLAAVSPGPSHEAPVLERVEIVHNRSLPASSLLFYVSSRPGDRYDAARLKQDFRRLLATGLLDDLSLEVHDGATGKVVVFDVTEARRIRAVEYRGSRRVSPTEIGKQLRERGLELSVDAPYDDWRARKAEEAIGELLRDKGRPFARVKREIHDAGPGEVRVAFAIDDGPAVRLKRVVFTGDRVFSDRELRRHFKRAEDVDRLRELYLDRGYVTASVGPAKSSELDAPDPASQRWLRLDIPIQAGERYRVGRLSFEGLTLFDEGTVRPLFGLEPGDVYDESKVRTGYERLRDLYGRLGYVQWTAATRRSPDPARRVVDLVLALEEGRRYSVGRIRFAGNDTTRDRVIRREVFLNEGEVLDTEALKQSVRRLNQLGYFEPLDEPPAAVPSARREDALDLTFRVRERSGSRYSLGGGTSDSEGTFLNASYSTANFLGLGETLGLTAQAGSLVRDYRVSLSEPYLLGRPISGGFEVFDRKLTYRTETSQGIQGYVDARTGVSFTTGTPLGRWARLSLGYSYQVVDVSLRDATGLDSVSLVSAALLNDAGGRHESSLRPSLVRDSVDDPFRPRRGTRLSLSLPVTGGPLGGSLDFAKPDLEAIAFVPHTSRSGLGLRAQAGWVLPLGDTALTDPASGRDQLPFYQRFFLGGESQIRGYDVRSVGPRDASGQAVGGNKYLLFNGEYYVDPFQRLRLVFFYDAGQAFANGQGYDLGRLRTSTGVEARITVPVLRVPLRFIHAVNPNRDPFQPAHAFRFAIGTTF
jgi:outer membrane protein insertion porin family